MEESQSKCQTIPDMIRFEIIYHGQMSSLTNVPLTISALTIVRTDDCPLPVIIIIIKCSLGYPFPLKVCLVNQAAANKCYQDIHTIIRSGVEPSQRAKAAI